MSSQSIKHVTCPDAKTLQQFLNDELTAANAGTMQEHIDACATCQQVLGNLVGTLPGPLDALPPPPPGTMTNPVSQPASAPPPQFPGYEILAEIGRGGMGVVYKARQLRPDRIVALKVLLAGVHAGAKERTRFLHEAEAVARLQHPHVVALYEAGQHGDLPYFTLEFISGGSLAAALHGTPLSPQNATRVVEQLARGMHYAHERGILHRDLKPGNVLLQMPDVRSPVAGVETQNAGHRTPESAQLRTAIPKITDFGLAKIVADCATLTTTGAVFGTPPYMSPEQAGSSKEVGVATDVYALGAILYECLTGRPPFQGPTSMDTLLQVLESDPVPPSELQRSVPRDLETICLKCLHKEPQRRYASARELAEDLCRFQTGEPIHARPVGRLERVVKWCRRHPAVAALTAAVILVTLLAGGLVTWQWQQAESALAQLRSEKTARASRQVTALRDAAPGRVWDILEELAANRDEVLPLLRQSYQDEKEQSRRMRLALALLPVEPEMVREPLTEWMLHAEDPAEVLLVRDVLALYRAELTAPLWAKANDAALSDNVRFRALVALAAYDPDNPRWQVVGPRAALHVMWANPLHRTLWAEALRPVGQALLSAQVEASYYPLKVGTKWHYQVAASDGKKSQTVVKIEKIDDLDGQACARLEVFEKGQFAGTEHVRSTASGVFRHRFHGSDISPPIQLLKFPIKMGESWTGEHQQGTDVLKVICRIGKEQVDVPAGKYDTVAVQMEVVVNNKDEQSITFWFAEGIGAVKQMVIFHKKWVGASTVGLMIPPPFGPGPFSALEQLINVRPTTITVVLEKFEAGK